MKLKHLIAGSVSALVLATSLSFAAPKIDSGIKPYKKTSGVSGKINSVGSDTLANLMQLWTEEFRRQYPNVEIKVQAAGSSTAPPALTQGTSNMGPMSRKMKDKEWQAFEKKNGYKPTRIRVAIDALAVFVHKDNPVKGLTIPQVDAIFSSTRKCGNKADIKKWGQLAMAGSWKGRNLQLFGRNSVSGTYGYFKKKALCKGDYKNSVNEQPGSSSVVQSVSTTISGIGYSGIGYKTSGVKAVALAKKPGQKFVAATPDNAISGKYPLARFLYIYINKHPKKPLPPQVKEFVKMILSQQGQKVVVKDGYIPLPKKVVDKELAKLK
jgi:phosphate transport system substrate-binding protein